VIGIKGRKLLPVGASGREGRNRFRPRWTYDLNCDVANKSLR
jgi:hypothetical protein